MLERGLGTRGTSGGTEEEAGSVVTFVSTEEVKGGGPRCSDPLVDLLGGGRGRLLFPGLWGEEDSIGRVGWFPVEAYLPLPPRSFHGPYVIFLIMVSSFPPRTHSGTQRRFSDKNCVIFTGWYIKVPGTGW